ncbi:MAG: MFS transporter, partial [Bradyrhizobium sp.]
RLVQGVFVGGVVASTHTIGTEWASPNWRGAMSGLVGGGGAGIGALMASFVFLVMSSIFPGDAFAVWGWRCMFFAGLLSSLLGWFIFNNLEESPFFKEQQKRKATGAITVTSAPVRMLFSSSYRNILLLNLLVTFGGGAGYYLTSGYLPSFLKVVNGVPNSISSLILMGASVVALVSAIIFGAVSDFIGRKKTFLLVGICMAVLLPVCYLGMAKATDTTVITLYALAIAFLGNAGYAPILIFLNERFPTEIRASGTGLSWNRLCPGRHDADLRFAGERRSGADPDVAVGIHRCHLCDLPHRRVADPRDQGRFPLTLQMAAERSGRHHRERPRP